MRLLLSAQIVRSSVDFPKNLSFLPFPLRYVVQWRTRLEQLERKICRIVIRSGVRIICGTGLLLGPDIVLTSYHIVREIIKGDIAYQNVTLSFDYKLEEDGQTPSKETTCYLHEDWLIDYCEFSPHDLHVTEHCVEVEESHLDYALLRLSEQVGEAQIKKDIFRGWIELPEQEYIFLPEAPLFILHHPYGDPLSLALNTHSVLEINAKQTRVRYRTSTEDGSSGAPCFNTNWDLIAIHQSGDPDFCRSPLYNQGIPIDAIIRLFRKRGKMKLFVKQHERVLVSTEECFSLFPLTDILPVRFDFPEEQMSETVQSLLLVLLKKTILSGQSKGNILSEPICINERTIECIAGVITPDQATSLVNGYVQVAYKNIEQVQQIFYHRGDIRIAQFTLARNVLENAALCLQRFCALLNHIADLPKMVLSDIRVSLCLRATKIIERCSQLCLDIKSVQEKDPSDREQRENFHERCREMLEWLKDIKERCGRNEG
jgi:hypothetical protein